MSKLSRLPGSLGLVNHPVEQTDGAESGFDRTRKIPSTAQIRTRDGKEYEAGGQPLRVPGRQAGGKPWIRVHMFDSVESSYLSNEIIRRAGELFDQAEAAVADNPVLLKRVHKERLGIEVVRISRPAEFLPNWQAYDQAVESFARIAAEWNIENIREGGSFNRQLKQWRDRAKRLKDVAEAADP